MDASLILLGISLIIFFGFLAEFIFKKIGVPDILLLVILGFIIGPSVMGYVQPASLAAVAPVFTIFALMFLMFEGSLAIDLASFTRGLLSGSTISFYNFILSSAVLTFILAVIFQFDVLVSLMLSFVFSGVSSAFVIPVIKQMNVKGDLYTILTLEGALTDVYTIVFSLTVLEIIRAKTFAFQGVVAQVASLFAIACLIGFVAAILWIFLDQRVFNGNKSYMSTIAFLILIYLITEYLGGNGAISSLFFGIFLKNSKQITSIISWVQTKDEKERKLAMEGHMGVNVLTDSERMFFSQISFFLKTFFFVYIGVLLNLMDIYAVMVGVVLAIAIMGTRRASLLITQSLSREDRSLVNAIFARGLAAAAVIQIIVLSGVITDPRLVDITYVVIVSTIILSSAAILIHKTRYRADAAAK